MASRAMNAVINVSRARARVMTRGKRTEGNGARARARGRAFVASSNARELERPPSAETFATYEKKSFFTYECEYESKKSRARVGVIRTPHGDVRTPGYVAVGTNAALKAVKGEVLSEAGIDMMFANTYHVLLQPGADVVGDAFGGLHRMMGRRGALITDSGGFQVFSLGMDENEDNNKGGAVKELKSRNKTKHKQENLLLRVDEAGVLFKSYRDGATMSLTPESSVEAQKKLGADIIIPLDELPPYNISDEKLEESVYRSHRWMARSLRTHLADVRQQAMYGVVHGGVNRDLRKLSVEYLSSLPFDGLAIGGSLGRDSDELIDLLSFLMPLVPRDKPNHLLGIADIGSVERAVTLGVDTFDSCYPTQVARHGTLFTHSRGKINFRRAEFRTSTAPACYECACTLCTKHSLGYLNHLDKANEPLAWTLASEHNLHFMGTKMAKIRQGILDGEI